MSNAGLTWNQTSLFPGNFYPHHLQASYTAMTRSSDPRLCERYVPCEGEVVRKVRQAFGADINIAFHWIITSLRSEFTVCGRLYNNFVCLYSTETVCNGKFVNRPNVAVRLSYHCLCDFFPEGGVGQTQVRMPTYVSISRIPKMIRVWRASVEWCSDRGKPKNSEEKMSQCQFVHHKSHMDWPRREPGPPRWEANDLSHGTVVFVT
jgi:hypothetical protein